MIQKLIGIEWMKIRSYKTFWIMLGLFILGFFGLVYVMYAIKYETSGQVAGSFLDTYFRYPKVAQLTAYMGTFMLLVLGIILITQVANEFGYRTHRQNIIDGLDRIQFINAKWYIIILLSLLAGLTHVLLTSLFALMGDGGTNLDFLESLEYSFYFALDAFMWLSVALMLSLWLKRSGLAISLYIVYGLVVENLLGYFFKRGTGVDIGEYFPIAIVDGLCPNIFLSFITSNGRPSNLVAVLITCFYLVEFYYLSTRIIKRIDLK